MVKNSAKPQKKKTIQLSLVGGSLMYHVYAQN